MEERKFRWGIMGTGGIAHTFARAVRHSFCGVNAAVGSRGLEKARTFALEFDVPRAHGSYEELLADAEVDGIYIALPHPLHHEWSIRALQAGKHVLCEKPLAINRRQAQEMFSVAESAGVRLMEAFMYRCHPQTAKLIELLRDGVIGQVQSIAASFSFRAPYDPSGRLFASGLGGGSILDVGCYPVSLARLVAGVAQGKPFDEPLEVRGVAKIGATGVDHWAAACLRFPGDILAQVSSGLEMQQENVARIYGSEGWMLLPNPWVAGREKGDPGNVVFQRGGITREVSVPVDRTSYSYEADFFASAVLRGDLPPHPAMTPDDSLGQMATLDRWRQSIGLTYEVETPLPA